MSELKIWIVEVEAEAKATESQDAPDDSLADADGWYDDKIERLMMSGTPMGFGDYLQSGAHPETLGELQGEPVYGFPPAESETKGMERTPSSTSTLVAGHPSSIKDMSFEIMFPESRCS